MPEIIHTYCSRSGNKTLRQIYVSSGGYLLFLCAECAKDVGEAHVSTAEREARTGSAAERAVHATTSNTSPLVDASTGSAVVAARI